MKNKILLLIIVLSLILSACGPNKDECDLQWEFMDVDPDMEGLIINMILNDEHPPDSVGELLQKCIRNGWLPDDLD